MDLEVRSSDDRVSQLRRPDVLAIWSRIYAAPVLAMVDIVDTGKTTNARRTLMDREQVAEAMAAIRWQPTYGDIERDEDGDFVESKHYLTLRELVTRLGDALSWYWSWEGGARRYRHLP